MKQIDPVKNNIDNIKDGFNIMANVKYAAQKDGGLNPVILSELLKDFDLKRKPDNLLLPLDMEDFRKFAEHLRVEFLKMSFPDKKE